ncbi:MAG TPA: hypothetical protein VF013_08660 [Candidatus Limnocylindria bacterium]
MWLRRTSILLATLAALLSAPSAASAASNRLLNPVASPASGTTTTAFTLRVDYRSASGTAATSVRAEVAAEVLAMSLASGTAIDGTWSVTTTLPAGRWGVLFVATTAKGLPPQLVGPTITVTALLPAPSVGGGTSPADPTSLPSSSAPADVTPSGSPQGTPGSGTLASPPAGASAAPAPGTAGGATAPPATGGTAGGAAGGSSGGSTSGTSAGSNGAPADAPAASAPPGPSGGAAEATPPAAPAGAGTDASLPGRSDALVWTVIMIGLGGVGLVAVAGTLWVLAGHDRRDEPRPVPAGETAEPDLPLSPARALRRARLRPADDPILAALGLNEGQDPDEATTARRSPRPTRRVEQVSAGPAERATHLARRRRGG